MAWYAFKVLCPEPLLSSILGTRGSTKNAIQDECRCKLVMSNRDDFYPGTRLRLLVVQAEEPAAILRALDRVLDLLKENASLERSGSSGRTAVQGENDFVGKDSGSFILRCAVPSKVGSAIIGVRGANVQALKKECGIDLFIEKENKHSHQLCKLEGSSESIRMAMARINEHLADEAHARPQDLNNWASIRSFEAPAEEASRDWERGRSRSPRRSKNSDRWQTSADRGGQSHGHDSVRPPSNVTEGLEVLAGAVSGMPDGAMSFEYELTCELPPQKVAALIGPRGEHVKRTRRTTGADIHFDEMLPGAREQTLRIRGPILSVYRAHVQLMKTYHDDEAKSAGKDSGKGSSKGKDKGGKGKESAKGKDGSSKGRDGGKGKDSGGKSKESGGKSKESGSRGKGWDGGKARDGGGRGESREDLEGMLASLQRQLDEVKGKLGR
eukprot:TRINITY_DN25828_c0_g1_i1.p1 TRINITY_DN25828_c0_g1~~TRINITY_DN25828_c0_g1_i1.p1  ORF type:complete len:451 (-),score=95.51 TRINITY_DN25828_c0_g1_i1:69-1388(-)